MADNICRFRPMGYLIVPQYMTARLTILPFFLLVEDYLFLVRHNTCLVWSCLLSLILYSWDISEAKDISVVKHGIALCTPSVTRLNGMGGVQNPMCYGPRISHEMYLSRSIDQSQARQSAPCHPSNSFCTTRKVRENVEQALESLSQSSWTFFLEEAGF